MASVPVVSLTIVALGATFLAVVAGMIILVAALVVFATRKQRSAAGTSRAAVESAD